jgi:hypothetical protein
MEFEAACVKCLWNKVGFHGTHETWIFLFLNLLFISTIIGLYFYLVNSQFLIVLLKEKKIWFMGSEWWRWWWMNLATIIYLLHLWTLWELFWFFIKKTTFGLISFTILGWREKRVFARWQSKYKFFFCLLET